MKKGFLTWLLIIILGIVLLLNLAGLVIDILVGFNIFTTDLVILRGIDPIALIFSVAIITSNIFLITYLYKMKKQTLIAWHIFLGILALNLIYKIFVPTMIVISIPYFFIISFSLLIIIWVAIFFFLRKKLTN